MAKPLSQAEKNYIDTHGGTMKHRELSKQMLGIFEVSRTTGTICAYLSRRNVKNVPVCASMAVLIPFGPAVVKTGRLIRAMDNTGTSLHDIADLTDLGLEQVQGLINRGGIPAAYAARVKDFYKEMGEVV
ncbi:MAG: hypothetical protein JKY45_05695 [Emcibacter sp.]|nr:hypothetical protein [Emcibacter sp.]